MAFKKFRREVDVPDTPDELFRSLPRRKFPSEMPHQRAIMREYVSQGADKPDVALQLPTGSGKTLVGLMIGEWRRRKFQERVVYICPTRQLVHQTHSQSTDKYGLDALEFTGSATQYSPQSVTSYKIGEKLAITTYSSLFNIRPFFSDPDTIIIDDSHAAENYIASMWSLQIDKSDAEHVPLINAIAGLLKPHVSSLDYSRLLSDPRSPTDNIWVDKLPGPVWIELQDEFLQILETHVYGTQLEYPWSVLKEILHACHLYFACGQVLIRPLIPPTWMHAPFENAKHRIYMSATLGAGGDLERLTGRENIHRLPIPDGFELQGVGRRFFMFPEMSLEPSDVEAVRLNLQAKAGRSVVLVPSKKAADNIRKSVDVALGYPVFEASDIEKSKTQFISEDKAVAVMANRYDGIDFPDDECRLLCVDGLPRAMNAQERFLMSRMGASLIFNDRVQTRVMQAIGRCTRALQDSSAVFVTGTELQDYLADLRKLRYLDPELQAEIEFGIEQSKEARADDFVENFEIFLANESDWAHANSEIVSTAKSKTREYADELTELKEVADNEIRFQKALAHKDFRSAVGHAKTVLAGLRSSNLRGYRALWHYLCGCAAFFAGKGGETEFMDVAETQFTEAKKAANQLPWLSSLSRYSQQSTREDAVDEDLYHQVEQLESYLCALGIKHDGKFERVEKEILEGILGESDFEQAHKKLGELLGFEAGKIETDGSPDPWWISKETCFVFEDHAGADSSSTLGAGKARQVAGHPAWMLEHYEKVAGLNMVAVLITPVVTANEGAKPHLKGVYVWPLEDFRHWARKAVSVVRELRSSLNDTGDLVWRAEAHQKLKANGISASTILEKLRSSEAVDYFFGT